jgi:hypothetical protein
MKLGKLPVKHDDRTLRLANYLDLEALPPPPKEVTYSKAVKTAAGDAPFGMLKNDELGDCTIAGALHMEQIWSANAGNPLTVTDQEAIEGYERICGYKPSDPNSDQGGIELDVLNAWRKDGIGGRQIVAFVKLNPHNENEVRTAMFLFGGIYTGFALPESAQNQNVWTPVRGSRGAPGSWGGHAIPFVDYTHDGKFVCVTWGALKKATWSFFSKYCDEAYAIVSKDFLDSKGKTMSGLDLDGLMKDLKSVTKVSGKAAASKSDKGAKAPKES